MGNKVIFVLLLLMLANCAGSPYEEGKSVADIPTHIDSIYLKDVYMSGGDKYPNGDPMPDTKLSQNDQEVAAVVKANIANQLTNFGYKIIEKDTPPADITMSYFITYMPERLLVSRSVAVTGRVYDANGTPIFSMHTFKTHDTGNLLGNLVNAVAGSTRDEMVSDATRATVVNIVNEIRKGMKEDAIKETITTTTTTTTVTTQAPGSNHVQ